MLAALSMWSLLHNIEHVVTRYPGCTLETVERLTKIIAFIAFKYFKNPNCISLGRVCPNVSFIIFISDERSM